MKQISDLKTAILYAEAMYGGSEEAGTTDALYKDAERLRDLAAEESADFEKLNNPLWKYSQKEEILEEICKKLGFSQSMLNTLKLLAQEGKLNLTEKVMSRFITLYHEKHGIAEVEVTTVVPLSSAQEDLLKTKLQNIFHKQILPHYVIDPQIIGGLVIKYGTHFIDNSIKQKLGALEQLMKGAK